MRITGLRTTVVSIPFSEPETWIWGRREGVTNILIELHTDKEIVGLGEVPGHPSAAVQLQILRQMEPFLVGEDPYRVEHLVGLLEARGGWHHYPHTGHVAIGGVEMALWDIIGKAVNQPLHRMFGGKVRDAISYYQYIPLKRPAEMATLAAAAASKGFQTLYIKVGFSDKVDLEQVKTVRQAAGNGRVRLRVDANEAWGFRQAVAMTRQLAEFGLDFVEEPVSMNDLDLLARVRAMSPIPIAANQSAWTERDVHHIIKREAADVVCTCPHQLNGLFAFKKVAYMCEVAGLPIVKHSFGDFGITTLATAHVLATCRNATLPHQTHLQYLQGDVIEGGPPQFQGGAIVVPDAPGIGVSLDQQKVKQYASLYEEMGDFSVYTPVEIPQGFEHE